MVKKSKRGYVFYSEGAAPADQPGLSLSVDAKTSTESAIADFGKEVRNQIITRISFDEHQVTILLASGHYISFYYKLEFRFEDSSAAGGEFSVVDGDKNYGFMVSLGRKIIDGRAGSDRTFVIMVDGGIKLQILRSDVLVESYTLTFPSKDGFVTI